MRTTPTHKRNSLGPEPVRNIPVALHDGINMFPMNIAGSLQLDLTSLIKPATSARSCKLPSGTSSEPTVDLFRQKRCYGWWAMSSMKTGTLKNTVCFLSVAAYLKTLNTHIAYHHTWTIPNIFSQPLPSNANENSEKTTTTTTTTTRLLVTENF